MADKKMKWPTKLTYFFAYSGGQITNVKNKNDFFLNLDVGSNFVINIHLWHL